LCILLLPMSTAIREAVVADARALAELNVACWKEAFRGLVADDYLDALSAEGRVEKVARRVEEAPGPAGVTNLVCEADGRVVGFVDFGPSRDDDAEPARVAEINGIYVHPGAWGKGFGRRLMQAALERITARGFCEVTLWTLRGNDAAIGFYRRMGFASDGAEQTAATAGGVELHEIRFRRCLRRPAGPAPLNDPESCA
jgi:ribosomal protein S18 acetylase RimI-like enzyme